MFWDQGEKRQWLHHLSFFPWLISSTLGCKTLYILAFLTYCPNLRPLMTDDDFDHWEKIDVGRAAAGDGG